MPRGFANIARITERPYGFRMCVVYKFLCVGCNACYVGETYWHLSMFICLVR